ncbi:MAG: sugar phosphate isomerase/epimerase family protein [Sedimentibacter sp.]
MMKERLYVATIASDAVSVAADYKLGMEIDEFCTASNMDDENFYSLNINVRNKMSVSNKHIFHAPFNELFPAAVDPLALDLAYRRFEQAYKLSYEYGIKRMVVHSGYVPFLYFKSWFLEKSVEFWQKFMIDKPEDFHIMIENVLEYEPFTLAKIIEQIGDKRVTACLDVGHANCKSNLNLLEWVETLGPFLGHVHLHNNDMVDDCHWTLGKGLINMNKTLESLNLNSPADLTYTVENSECRESIQWLVANGWLK